jgi:hypothetical protein
MEIIIFCHGVDGVKSLSENAEKLEKTNSREAYWLRLASSQNPDAILSAGSWKTAQCCCFEECAILTDKLPNHSL